MKKELYIYGAGGLGREILCLVQQAQKDAENEWLPAGWIDDGYPVGTIINGLEVKGGVDFLSQLNSGVALVVAVGDPVLRKKLVESALQLCPPIIFPTFIHPSVIFGDKESIKIGAGSLICAGVIMTTDIVIGSHCLLNLAVTIGHDTRIGDYSSIMPSVNVSGEVEIGEAVFVGSGANIINQLQIGDQAKIGAGAVVISHVHQGRTAVGVPARMTKKED